jgi:acylphosphatase
VSDSLQAARWLIAGRVQGVGFRWFVRHQAENLGITGWARNLPDGRVEVAASGAAPMLERFDRALRRGPRFSDVEHVEKIDVQHEDVDCKSFSIK